MISSHSPRLLLLLGALAVVLLIAGGTWYLDKASEVSFVSTVATSTPTETIQATTTVQVTATTTPKVVVAPKPKPTQPAVVIPPPVYVPPAPTTSPPVIVPPASVIGTTTLTVSLVPLLSGGTVHAGQSVPVSYLQIRNSGTNATYITGFEVEQTGTAETDAIVQLTTVDDKGGSRGATTGSAPFSDNKALAPTNARIEPGTLRLFTIKAVLGTNVSSFAGTNLQINVTSVETDATVHGNFPIHGTTWIIQ